jgi:hypothetical protein
MRGSSRLASVSFVFAAMLAASLDSATIGKVVRSNHVSGVGGTCIDVSPGGGTAGTGNIWTGNTATVSSSPVGICAVAA